MRYFIKPTHLISIAFDVGWGNGYVVIPKEHPLWGVGYDDIDVDVHGGLTYSEMADNCMGWKEVLPSDKGCWVVGFDTAHLGDNPINCNRDYVLKETIRLREQLINYSSKKNG